MAPGPRFHPQCRPGDFYRIMTLDHRHDTVHLTIGIRVQSRRTSGDHDLYARILSLNSSNVPASIGIGLIRDGACVDHADLGT